MTDLTKDQPYGQMDFDFAARAVELSPEEDGPIWMVNLMAYKRKAVYDGVESDIDGKEADNRYNPIDVLMKIGASLVFVGDVIEQGPNPAPHWDRIAVVKYPTRRSFVEMGARKDFQEKHVHKQAGMDQTIVCGCLPVPGALDVVPEAKAVEADESDGPVNALHIVQFERGKDIAKKSYLIDLAKTAVAYGGTVDALMSSETTFLGDGRNWDQVLMVTYPSRATFDAASKAQSQVGDDIVADRYDILVRPMINEMRKSQIETARADKG
ncbi:MAG: hypothetical protein AAFQ66_03455 [Pseudomonadota bacterium]